MATDKSEPRIGLIVRIGIFAAVLLMAVRVALAAYFDEITQAEEHRKIVEAKPEALLSLRSDEQKRLTEGRLPIIQAMHELAAKGRSPDIAPIESRDLSPLQGWSRMPAAVPAPMIAASGAPAPSASSAPAPSASGAPAPSTSAGPAAPSIPGRSTRPPAGGPPSPPGTPKNKP